MQYKNRQYIGDVDILITGRFIPGMYTTVLQLKNVPLFCFKMACKGYNDNCSQCGSSWLGQSLIKVDSIQGSGIKHDGCCKIGTSQDWTYIQESLCPSFSHSNNLIFGGRQNGRSGEKGFNTIEQQKGWIKKMGMSRYQHWFMQWVPKQSTCLRPSPTTPKKGETLLIWTP